MSLLDLRVGPDVLGDSPVCAVAPATSVAAAAKRMREVGVRSLAVVGEDGGLIGLVSERDIVHRLVADGRSARNTPIEAVMTADPDRLAPSDLAVDALDLMEIREVDCLPVVDGDTVVGMVTLIDLCETMRHEMEQAIEDEHDAVFGSDRED